MKTYDKKFVSQSQKAAARIAVDTRAFTLEEYAHATGMIRDTARRTIYRLIEEGRVVETPLIVKMESGQQSKTYRITGASIL